MTYLNVSEVFGPTVQGEGRNTGRLASFLRLAGCNLTCSWCDSAYTWDWSRFDKATEVHRQPIEDVADTLRDLPGRIVVTGGEPLLQAPALAELQSLLIGRTFDVETNGTRPVQGTAWATVTCSPKIIPSADTYELARSLHDSVVNHPGVEFKFVVADQADLTAVESFVEDYQLPGERVWLMPEGTDTATLSERTPRTVEWAVGRGWNVSTRLHVYAWGDERGH